MYPHYWAHTLLGTNTPHGRLTKKDVYNRTGGTLTVGGIYQFDVFKSLTSAESANTESPPVTLPAVTAWTWKGLGSAFSNIVAPGARGDSGIDLTMWGGIFCVALTAALDNEKSEVLLIGECTPKVIGATTAVYSTYSPFRVTTGQVYGTMLIAATAPVGKVIGMITETIYTEATTPAATAHTAFFNGFGFPC